MGPICTRVRLANTNNPRASGDNSGQIIEQDHNRHSSISNEGNHRTTCSLYY